MSYKFWFLMGLILFSLWLYAHASMSKDQAKEAKERLACDSVGCHAYKVWVDGHTYIQFSKGTVHDPDCPCGSQSEWTFVRVVGSDPDYEIYRFRRCHQNNVQE